MSNIVINLIKLYKIISTGVWTYRPAGVLYSSCKFYPSCSEYTQEAVKEFGVIKGLTKGFKRLSRCHPLSKGGFDPVK